MVTFGWSGGWAEQRAVDTDQLAPLPAGLEAADGRHPPGGRRHRTAGAARRSARCWAGGSLVTGASGGVGPLRRPTRRPRSGAHVVAAVGSPGRGEGLAALGAAEVVVGLGQRDGVGGAVPSTTSAGPLLADVFRLIEEGGTVLSVGMASGLPTTLDLEHARIHTPAGHASWPSRSGDHFGPDLDALARLLAAGGPRPAGRLAGPVGRRGRRRRRPARAPGAGQGRPGGGP